MKLEYSRQILEENSQISNRMKILPVGAELFNANGRTDRHDEAYRRFSQFCECALKTIEKWPLLNINHNLCSSSSTQPTALSDIFWNVLIKGTCGIKTS